MVLFPSLLSAVALAAAAPAIMPGLPGWRVEAEAPARVTAAKGVIDIDSAGGLTLWLERPLQSPVTIRFDVRAVRAGGPNDNVSDVNAFWMAQEADGSLPRPRSGRFEDYDTLRTYYVGIGGNRNTTTRMRRYIARAGERPLLPQHDRRDASALLRANRWMNLALVADGRRIAVLRDGRMLFTLDDAAPYRQGWFGIRTTSSHLQVRRVRIVQGH